jgi:hypothetical protein
MAPHPAAIALVVIVRLYGEHTVEPDVLLSARSAAEAIFQHSGVAVEWRSCIESPVRNDCSAAMAPNEVAARFLAGPASVSADSCGVALVPRSASGHFMSVFVECVRRAADRLRLAEHVLLGCVLVHEIGHLLLGTNSHGTIGLMQAQPRPIDWERAAVGALVFTPDETLQLRGALERRISDLSIGAR